jgi:hypothetical protein
MPAQPTTSSVDDSLLLELLHYAGWRLRISESDGVTIRAVRDGVEVRASATSLPAAAGVVFARAMRRGREPRST